MVLWSGLIFLFGTLLSLVRWGDLNLNRDIGKMLSIPILRALGIRIEVTGMDRMPEGPKIFVANHQSGFELIVFGFFCPDRTVFIGKKEIIWIPLFGLYFLAAGNIVIDRSRRNKAVATLSRAAAVIRRKQASVMVFPEGTRNRGEEPLLPFKRGPLYLALEAQVPIVPLVVSPIKNVFSWKQRILQSGVIQIQVLPPVSTEGTKKEDATRLATEVREAMLSVMTRAPMQTDAR